jgi:hypothetical protein
MVDSAVEVDDKRILRAVILDDHELVRPATAEGKTALVTRPFVLPLWTGRPWPDRCPNGEGRGSTPRQEAKP